MWLGFISVWVLGMKRLNRRFDASWIGWLLAAIVVAGCQTVPETGRRQFNVFSTSDEMQLGLTSFTQMKTNVPISHDPKANALVQKVGQRIAAVAALPGAQWEFVVFESKEANAFCLPGGKVGVYTGILPICRDEAGLATVLGHEVAHAVARHGGARMTEAVGLQLGGALAQSWVDGSKFAKYGPVAKNVWGLGTQLGIALPHSRLQESEADEIGLLYMARAGYPPAAAVDFWQRFAAFNQQQGGTTPWFLRTHPTDDQRVAHLKSLLPKAESQLKAP